MADIVTDLSIKKNWNVARGFNNTFTFTFTQSGGGAFVTTTYTFSLQIRRFGATVNTIELTQASGITNGGASGIVTVVLTAAQSALLTDVEYFWQLTVVHPDTFTYRWYNGTLVAKNEIYSGDTASGITTAISINGTSVTGVINIAASPTLSSTGTLLQTAAADTPLDADTFNFWDAIDAVLKKVTWANIKSTFQRSYDNGDGTIRLINGKPLIIYNADGTKSPLYIDELGNIQLIGNDDTSLIELRVGAITDTYLLMSKTALAIVSSGNVSIKGKTMTTVGGNLFSLPNPSAVRFLRINADNTVTSRTASETLNDLGISGLYENLYLTFNEQVNDYTLVLTDKDTKEIRMNKATAISLTVPPDSSVAFPAGTKILVKRTGAGQLTIVQGSGVTVTASAGVLTDAGQNVIMALIKTAANTWDLENGTSGGSGTDANAIHVNTANEISGVTEKTTLADDDLFIIEDSAAAGVKKKVKRKNVTREKVLFTNCVPSSAVTGDTAEHHVEGFLIAGGTLQANDIIEVFVFTTKSGTANAYQVRININDTNDLTTDTTIGTIVSGGATTITNGFIRRLFIESTSAQSTFPSSVTSAADDAAATTVAYSALTEDLTTNKYITISLQNSSAADSTVVRAWYIKLIRA